MLEPKGVGIPRGWSPNFRSLREGKRHDCDADTGRVSTPSEERSDTFRPVGLRGGDIRERVISLGTRGGGAGPARALRTGMFERFRRTPGGRASRSRTRRIL
jgi:hypothetical protein